MSQNARRGGMQSFSLILLGIWVSCGKANPTETTSLPQTVPPTETTPEKKEEATGPCAHVTADAKLGSLKLHSGFVAAETSPLAPGIVSATSVQGVLYGIHGTEKRIQLLGRFPQTEIDNMPSWSVSKDATSFMSSFLVNDGTSVMTGYTLPSQGAPGEIVWVNTQTKTETRVSAPGNYTAAMADDFLLINGTGVDTLSKGPGIYALTPKTSTLKTYQVAEFDKAWAAASGYTAVTSDGIAVLGYFNGTDFLNYLRAVPSDVYRNAISTGTPLALSAQTQVYSGADLFNVLGMGKGVVLHRGDYDPTTYAPITKDVSWLPLSTTTTQASAGAIQPILTVTDTCTEVLFVSTIQSDLLVGVNDKNGRRLVRVTLEQNL